MNYFLAIETALDVCSVALSREQDIILLKEEKGNNIHSARLTLLIQDILNESGIDKKELSAIIISKGPGSYTGLRIGVSAAKGLAFALDKPLISVNTLTSLSWLALQFIREDAWLCPMIDARRMEVYWSLRDMLLNEIRPPAASIVNEEFLSNLPPDKPVYFFGNGMGKCRELLSNLANSRFIENIEPSAKPLIALGIEKFEKGEFEDVSSFEPFYLKDFFTPSKTE